MEDLSSGSKDANTDAETVRAAMLSGSHIFKGLRESYVLRRLLPGCITSDCSATVTNFVRIAEAEIVWIRRIAEVVQIRLFADIVWTRCVTDIVRICLVAEIL